MMIQENWCCTISLYKYRNWVLWKYTCHQTQAVIYFQKLILVQFKTCGWGKLCQILHWSSLFSSISTWCEYVCKTKKQTFIYSICYLKKPVPLHPLQIVTTSTLKICTNGLMVCKESVYEFETRIDLVVVKL